MTTAALFGVIAVVLAALSVHEFAHAWVADWLGDPTPRYQGRVTLDPLAHLHPLGTLMILMTALTGFGIGWGKPVPVNVSNFKGNKSLGMAMTSAAGPLSNIVQAAFAASLVHLARFIGYQPSQTIVNALNVLVLIAGLATLAAGAVIFYRWAQKRIPLRASTTGTYNWRVVDPRGKLPPWENPTLLRQVVRLGLVFVLVLATASAPNSILLTAVFVNLGLALFNLIPLGPLDGKNLVRGLLLSWRSDISVRLLRFLDQIEPHSMYILLGMVFVEQFLRIPVLSGPLWAGVQWFASAFGL
ncbi:MAG: site-2 protease family protein [Chloroflexota bacterium]